MHCPSCNTPMNRHAEKTIKDPHVGEGEVVASVYYCPRCGKVEAKVEIPPSNDRD